MSNIERGALAAFVAAFVVACQSGSDSENSTGSEREGPRMPEVGLMLEVDPCVEPTSEAAPEIVVAPRGLDLDSMFADRGPPRLESPRREVTPRELDHMAFLPEGIDMLPDPLQDGRPIPSLAQIELGRSLFFDPRLSVDGSTSCASCHDPHFGFADGMAKARGFGGAPLDRHTPSLFHAVFATSLGWDGAHDDLEDLTYDHLFDRRSMNAGPALVDRLEQTDAYPRMFEGAFGHPMGEDEIAVALASFVRVLPPSDSPFDLYCYGEIEALDDQQKLGLSLFVGKAGCVQCHPGPLFSDGQFHDLGLKRGADRGRFEVTGRRDDIGRFRTPTLRDVARTAPYFHDGSAADLRQVVEFYDGGGGRGFARDSRLRPLGLREEEKQALVEFLSALSGEAPEPSAPELPRDL